MVSARDETTRVKRAPEEKCVLLGWSSPSYLENAVEINGIPQMVLTLTDIIGVNLTQTPCNIRGRICFAKKIRCGDRTGSPPQARQNDLRPREFQAESRLVRSFWIWSLLRSKPTASVAQPSVSDPLYRPSKKYLGSPSWNRHTPSSHY